MKYLVLSVTGLLVSIFLISDLLSANTVTHSHNVSVEGKTYVATCEARPKSDICMFEKDKD